MTCKEAVKSLKNIAILGTEKAIEDGMEAIGVAIEALEKQIPKEPIIEIDYGCFPFFEKDYLLFCPNCGDQWNANEYGSGMKYCWECGQKIYWEGVEECV